MPAVLVVAVLLRRPACVARAAGASPAQVSAGVAVLAAPAIVAAVFNIIHVTRAAGAAAALPPPAVAS